MMLGAAQNNTQQSCLSNAYGARSAAASATAARSEAPVPGSTGGVTISLPGGGSILTSPSCKMGGTTAAAGRVVHVGDTFISTGVNEWPVLINVSPTRTTLPAAAGVPPILQDRGVKIDPSPGKLVVTPPVEPDAGASDRVAVAEAAAERAP